jgi:hypothetical protein
VLNGVLARWMLLMHRTSAYPAKQIVIESYTRFPTFAPVRVIPAVHR